MGDENGSARRGMRVGSLGGITLFGFDLFTHNNADSDAASLNILSSKKSLIPKALKRPRRRRGTGGRGGRRLVCLAMERSLKVFWGVDGLALLFVGVSSIILGLGLNPSKRGKVHCTLHLPLLQQDDTEADLDGGLDARTRKSTNSVTSSVFVERCALRLAVLHFGFRFLK